MALTVSVDEIVHGSRNPLLGARPHWKRIRIGEVASVLNGFAFKSTQFTKGDGMPLIRIRDVGSDSTDTNYVGEFDERYIVEPGDLLVGMDGDFNCARWRGPRGLLNQRVCKVTLNSDQYHPRLLDFALPGYLKAINDATSSVTVKHLSSRTVEDIPLPFPPLREQEEIVAELEKQFSRLDEAVTTLSRTLVAIRAYRASVLEAAIRGQLVSESVPTHASRLDDVIGPIHQGWSPKCDLQREPGQDEWAVITTTAVQPMKYIDNQGKPLPAALAPRPQLEIQPGDFLVTRKGPRARAGVACLVRQTRRRLMVCDTVYRFRCDEAKAVPDYLEIALNAPSVVQAIDRQKAGINESGVSLTHQKLGGIAIPVPSREAQQRVVAEVDRRLSIVREVEAEVDVNLKRAQALRQAVLAAAFGKR